MRCERVVKTDVMELTSHYKYNQDLRVYSKNRGCYWRVLSKTEKWENFLFWENHCDFYVAITL